MKQEPLEEVAHKMLNDYGIKSMGQSIGVLEVKKLMVKMAKWQTERSYSEEEVLKFTFYCNENYTFHNNFYIWVSNTDFTDRKTSKELLEQFKKK